MECPRVCGGSHVQRLGPNEAWYSGKQLCVALGTKANYAPGLVDWDKVVGCRYHLGDDSPFVFCFVLFCFVVVVVWHLVVYSFYFIFFLVGIADCKLGGHRS